MDREEGLALLKGSWVAQRNACRIPAGHSFAAQLAERRGGRADPRGGRRGRRAGWTGARHCRNTTNSWPRGYADRAFRPSGILVRLRAHCCPGWAAAARRRRQNPALAWACSPGCGANAPHPTTEWWRELTRLSIIYGDVAQNVAADLLIRDSERRCAAVLLRLGGRRFPSPGDEQSVEVPIRQDELAGAANLSRNSVGTILQRLKARRLVEPGYRGMTISSAKALRAFVDED